MEEFPGQDLSGPRAPDDFFGEDEGEDEDEGFDDGEPQADLGRSVDRPALVAQRPSGDGGQFRFAVSPPEPGGPGVTIRLVAERRTVRPGDSFEVAVAVDAARAVSHLPMTLSFDPTLLEVLGVEAGDFLGATGEATVLADVSRPGRVVLGASRLGDRAGVAGAGAVATVRFRALKEGQAFIGFVEGEALDRELRPVAPLRKRRAIVRVTPNAAKPELPESDVRQPPTDARRPNFVS